MPVKELVSTDDHRDTAGGVLNTRLSHRFFHCARQQLPRTGIVQKSSKPLTEESVAAGQWPQTPVCYFPMESNVVAEFAGRSSYLELVGDASEGCSLHHAGAYPRHHATGFCQREAQFLAQVCDFTKLKSREIITSLGKDYATY